MNLTTIPWHTLVWISFNLIAVLYIFADNNSPTWWKRTRIGFLPITICQVLFTMGLNRYFRGFEEVLVYASLNLIVAIVLFVKMMQVPHPRASVEDGER